MNAATAPEVCDKTCSERAYAGAPEFSATRIDDTRHLLALVATVPVMCGSDSMLFIYRYEAAHWRESLRWQAAPYDSIRAAYQGLSYRIGPPDARGNWYVVEKHFPAWCSSMWSVVGYAALRPTLDPARPHVVYRGEDPVYLGFEEDEPFTAHVDAFELRFRSHSIDAGVHNRTWVRRFAVDGNRVERIAPFAANARDFVDEWLVTPWDRAAKWSSQDADAALEHWHTRLRGGDDHPSVDFEAMHACDGRTDAMQVEIGLDDDDGQPHYFFRVEGTPETYRMVRVGTEGEDACGGEDLLPTIGKAENS